MGARTAQRSRIGGGTTSAPLGITMARSACGWHAGTALRGVAPRWRTRTPDLQAVLAHVVPGRVAYLALTREQKRALRDKKGQLALDTLRHLLGARDAAFENAPEKIPVVELAFQAVARKRAHEIGINGAGA